MKLIYMYIGDINRCIKNQEISFSKDFKVSYSREHRELYIERTENSLGSMYGENIDEVKILVGRNGTGKSTVMKLLGLQTGDKKVEFPVYKNPRLPKKEEVRDWFVLYHIQENVFAIEGCCPEMLNFSWHKELQANYSLGFQYDLLNNKVLQETVVPLQKYRIKKRMGVNSPLEKCFYTYYQSTPSHSWYAEKIGNGTDSYSGSQFERYYLKNIGHTAITEYAYRALHNKKFSKMMDSVPTAFTVNIEFKWDYDEFSGTKGEKNEKLVYRGNAKFITMPDPEGEALFFVTTNLSNRQSMVVRYLESVLIGLLKEKDVLPEMEYQKKNNQEYFARKEYLLAYIEQFLGIRRENTLFDENLFGGFLFDKSILRQQDWGFINRFCESIEEIEEPFFKNGEEIHVPLKNCSDNFLSMFMKTVDENNTLNHYGINHMQFFRIKYENLSSGELEFINLYASLYWGIMSANHFADGSECIILLDEPDSNFHPEWQRELIYNLLELLQSEPFTKYRYQIIMSTHSPILLSDVARDDICCFERGNGKVQIRNAPYAFLSNINEIMLSSFFVSSPYGKFAEEYVNKRLNTLNEMEQEVCARKPREGLISELHQIEKEIEIIGEEIVKSVLEQKVMHIREEYYSNSDNCKQDKIKELLTQIRKLENDK